MPGSHPCPGQRLELALLAGSVAAEAEALDGERVVVRCSAELSVQELAGLHRRGELRYPGPDGLVVRPARLLEREGDRLTFRMGRRTEVVTRRDWARVDGLLDVTVHVEGPGRQRTLRTTAVNVSGGGMRCGALEGVDAATKLTVELPLRDGGSPLRVRAHVVRREPSGQLAIVFSGVDARDEDRIAAHVAAEQRRHLARGLR